MEYGELTGVLSNQVLLRPTTAATSGVRAAQKFSP